MESTDLIPRETDSFQTNRIYQTEPYRPHFENGNMRSLRFGVFGNEESGFEIRSRSYEYGLPGELTVTPARSMDIVERELNQLINSLPSGTTVMEVVIKPDKTEISQGERNVAAKPAAEKNTADNVNEGAIGSKETPNSGRSMNEHPSSEDDMQEETEYTGGTLIEDVERWIPSLFDPARKGIASIKDELESDVTEDNWIQGAATASFLDVLDTAMSFTEGIPLGLLDTRRFGEGIAKGTKEGVIEDASRALNVLPQGRVLRAVDRAITGFHIIEAVSSDADAKTTALTAGLGAASMAGGKAAAKSLRNKLGAAKPPLGKYIAKPKHPNKRAWTDSEMDTTDFLSNKFKKGTWSEQVTYKDGSTVKGGGRNPRDSTVPDAYNEKMGVAVESKRYDYLNDDDISKFLHQAGGRHINLPDGTKQWLVIDHRGKNLSFQDAAKKHAAYFKKLGGTSVFEKIFIVTEKGIIEF